MRPSRGILAAGAILSLLLLLLDAVFYRETLEDAYITFRYSEHLAEGYGLGAWNTNGERVEGYSSPLWMLWLAAAPGLGLAIPTLAKATGIAAHLALCWVFLLAAGAAWRAGDRARGDTLLLAGGATAAYLPLAWYATSGMETVPFAFLVALALLAPCLARGRGLPAAAGAALVLARPEGPLFAFAAGALHVLRARFAGRSSGPALATVAGAAGAFAAVTAFRLLFFGDYVPNTYHAKVAGGGGPHLEKGVAYLSDWAFAHAGLVLVLLAAPLACARALRDRRPGAAAALAVLLALCAGFGLYVLRVGGDNPSAFPYWRHGVHLFPVVALLAAATAIGLLGGRRRLALGVAALVAIVLAADARVLRWAGGRMLREARAGLRGYPHLVHAPHGAYLRWLAGLASPDTVIASAAAGEMPFVVDAVHVDMLGLNDRHIAHHGHFDPAGPVDSKTDAAYVLARRPDVIQLPVTVSKFLDARPGAPVVLRRHELTAGLIGRPEFQREYLLVVNAPYADLDRALFVRRSFYEGHPRRASLEVLPFQETPLYRHWLAPGRPGHAPRSISTSDQG